MSGLVEYFWTSLYSNVKHFDFFAGHVSKLGMPLEHAAHTKVMVKFGALDHHEMSDFVRAVEDVLFKCNSRREGMALYRQDEVQVRMETFYNKQSDF